MNGWQLGHKKKRTIFLFQTIFVFILSIIKKKTKEIFGKKNQPVDNDIYRYILPIIRAGSCAIDFQTKSVMTLNKKLKQSESQLHKIWP